MLYKRTEIGILLIAELDGNRIDTTHAIFEFNNAINLFNLTSRMPSTKRAGINDIAPTLPKMKISEFTFDFTKARWELNIHFIQALVHLQNLIKRKKGKAPCYWHSPL